ncbi:MAG: 1-deoxy-D-xylulose-5-phosphate reductoisomerase [Rubrivivax sp.]|nr:1-deoxy-D-xylulose-5-phosphate reductoisomerase [Rubrivivax sp.]
MSRPQRIAILGSTGSVGTSTLDVIARHPDRFEVWGLSGHSRLDELVAQCQRWQPRRVVVSDEAAAQRVRRDLAAAGLRTEVDCGAEALCQLAAQTEVDAVMAAIVGAAGLAPCMAAARAGKRLMLANKEALVVGGSLFMQAVRQGGATLLPVDSEHSAIFQCLPEDRRQWAARIDHILLTASGGPFRQRDVSTLSSVTPEEACAHPNWVMGRKISVDSATMMNKALEVIEAHWLFDLPASQVRVVLHPQSIVHSMVVCRDASVLAQMGTPDMRVPIAYALSHPQRIESGAASLDFSALAALQFEAMDLQRFPGLKLAYDCLAACEGSAAVLNAANEVAVEAFLERRIAFTAIHAVNCRTLESVAAWSAELRTVDDLLDLDRRARDAARRHAKELTL